MGGIHIFCPSSQKLSVSLVSNLISIVIQTTEEKENTGLCFGCSISKGPVQTPQNLKLLNPAEVMFPFCFDTILLCIWVNADCCNYSICILFLHCKTPGPLG